MKFLILFILSQTSSFFSIIFCDSILYMESIQTINEKRETMKNVSPNLNISDLEKARRDLFLKSLAKEISNDSFD